MSELFHWLLKSGLDWAVRICLSLAGLAFAMLTCLTIWAYAHNESAVLAGVEFGKSNRTYVTSEAKFPKGAIIVVVGECPAPWTNYLPAIGRFIVGAGKDHAPGYDKWDLQLPEGKVEKRDLMRYQPLDQGGEEKHRLTKEEMPSHTHDSLSSTGKRSPHTVDDTPEEFGIKDKWESTTASGLNVEHNNIPPYLALTFCTL